jgi:hypothetical protein
MLQSATEIGGGRNHDTKNYGAGVVLAEQDWCPANDEAAERDARARL